MGENAHCFLRWEMCGIFSPYKWKVRKRTLFSLSNTPFFESVIGNPKVKAYNEEALQTVAARADARSSGVVLLSGIQQYFHGLVPI